MLGTKVEIKYLQATDQTDQLLIRLKQFYQNFPNNPEFHFRYGLHLQQQNDYETAYQVFRH